MRKMHCSIDILCDCMDLGKTTCSWHKAKFWEKVIEVFSYFCTINFIAHLDKAIIKLLSC